MALGQAPGLPGRGIHRVLQLHLTGQHGDGLAVADGGQRRAIRRATGLQETPGLFENTTLEDLARSLVDPPVELLSWSHQREALHWGAVIRSRRGRPPIAEAASALLVYRKSADQALPIPGGDALDGGWIDGRESGAKHALIQALQLGGHLRLRGRRGAQAVEERPGEKQRTTHHQHPATPAADPGDRRRRLLGVAPGAVALRGLADIEEVEATAPPSLDRGLVGPHTQTAVNLDRIAENDLGAKDLGQLQGPGYLLPAEAIAQTQRGKTELELATASLSFSEFDPELNPSGEDLRDYYEANKQDYEIPERIEASYVLFPADDYTERLPEAGDAELRQHFAENRDELVAAYRASQDEIESPAEAEVKAEDEDEAPDEGEAPVTFDQVRPLVEQSYAEQRALRTANEAAQAFAFQLYRDEISRESAAFNQLLSESGLTLEKIEPYTRAGASRRALSPEMLESAFTLGGNRYFSDAYPVDGGFAVLIYEGRIAPVIPPFESVAGEIREAYLAAEKRRLFNEKGEALQSDLEAALAEGESFTDAAEALGLSTRNYDRFAVREAPPSVNRSIINRAQTMEAGELSSMLSLGADGTFIYVQSKNVPEIDSENEDFTQAQAMLQNWGAFSTRSSLLNELVTRGLPEQDLGER